jgi:hypothetical protein
MHFVIKDLLSPAGGLNMKQKIKKIGVIFKAKLPVAVAIALSVERFGIRWFEMRRIVMHMVNLI